MGAYSLHQRVCAVCHEPMQHVCPNCGRTEASIEVTLRRRRLPAPGTPSSPLDSELCRLLLALIESEATERPGLYWSAVLREEDRLAGRLSVAERYLPRTAAPELRALFAPGGNAFEAIVGVVLPDEFIPGLAGLTPQQARAVTLWLDGHRPLEIARLMDAVRLTKRQQRMVRRGEQPPTLSVAAVEQHLERGWERLRAFFGQLREVAA